MSKQYRNIADDIKGYLQVEQVKEIIIRDLGLVEKNGMYKCCMHTDSEKNPNMSYDKKRMKFHCFRCGGDYDIFEHYMAHYGLGFYDACIKIINDLNLPINLEDKAKPKEQPKKHEPLRDICLDYLHKRGFSDKTINSMPLSCDGKNVIFEYYNEYGVHEANKSRPARKFGKDEKKKYFWEGSTDGLYNMQNCTPTKPLIIIEGEMDVLAVVEAGYSNIVSVKAGASSYEWIDKCWEWLQRFDEIWLWYDNDRAGLEGVRTVSKRLDNCTKIIKSVGGKDANEILLRHGKEAVLKCIKEAVDLDVESTVNVRDIEDFNVYEAEKIRTGVRMLDANIHGFVAGTLDIITGYSGSGKSTIVNQMCIAEPISQGYKTFVFSGELTHANLKYWLYSTLANKRDIINKQRFDGTEYIKVSEFGYEKITEWINDKLYIYDGETNSEDLLLSTMEKLYKRKGVRVFVLDNLMMIRLNRASSTLEAQSFFIDRLKAFAKKYNVWVHLIAHPRKPQENGSKITKYDVSGSADITNLADYVIGIHRVSEAEKMAWEEERQKKGDAFTKPNPKDASIMLFKDRPTGCGDKEASLWFNSERRRFYLNDADLDFDYGYDRDCVQEDIGDLPF